MLNIYEKASRNPQIRLRLNLAVNESAGALVLQKEFQQAKEILLDNSRRFRNVLERDFRGNLTTRTLFTRQLQLLQQCHEGLGERTQANRISRRIQQLRANSRKDRAEKK